MKKQFLPYIAGTLILLTGLMMLRTRARPLISCFPETYWLEISGIHDLPGEDSDSDLIITPDQLKDAMEGISVRPRSEFSGWDGKSFSLHIQTETIPLSVDVGKNGDISIARLNDPKGRRTCWKAEDSSLYENLLAFTQSTP